MVEGYQRPKGHAEGGVRSPLDHDEVAHYPGVLSEQPAKTDLQRFRPSDLPCHQITVINVKKSKNQIT